MSPAVGKQPRWPDISLRMGWSLRASCKNQRLLVINENLENCFAVVENATALHVVTNEFHSLRTRLWAWYLNIPIKMHVALTPVKHRLRNYSREILATPHSAARIAWQNSRAFKSL